MSKYPCALAVTLLIICLASTAQAALFAIASPRFSAFVDPENYGVSDPAENGIISRSKLVHGLLYFSVTIVGDERAFQHLEENRHLGLEASIWCDGRRADSVSIGISTPAWESNREQLKYELDKQRFFSWRTYLNTKKRTCSTIELVLRDDDNAVIAPVGHRGTYRASVSIIP